jgi:DNA-binding NarL/FixJ family response regulator
MNGRDFRIYPEVSTSATWKDGHVVSRVLIVDDHAGFRRFARSLLQGEGLDGVGEAADENSALTAVARVRPGLVLLDVLLPGRHGFAVAERLREFEPDLAIVLISGRTRKEVGVRLREAPLRGLVHEDDSSASTLARALR